MNLDDLSIEDLIGLKKDVISKNTGTLSKLQVQLSKNKILLKKKNDLSAMDYVATLELIKEEIMNMKNNKTSQINIFYEMYDLVLQEIEDTFDDLTLNSLLLVTNQYENLKKINKGKIKFQEQRLIEKEIISRHEEFMKYLERKNNKRGIYEFKR